MNRPTDGQTNPRTSVELRGHGGNEDERLRDKREKGVMTGHKNDRWARDDRKKYPGKMVRTRG